MEINDVFAAWRESDPTRKCEQLRALAPTTRAPFVAELAPRAGFPARPALVDPKTVPIRALSTREGRAALLHAIAHIEFNAINLALDAALRFPDLPLQYYVDWVSVAQEEAQHFMLLANHLKSTYAANYGDFPAHDGLWNMAQRTNGDVLARMALVPRVMEARGLDVTPGLIEKLQQAGDGTAADILRIILRDEVGHVAIGNRWYAYLCAQRDVEPVAHFAALQAQYRAPKVRPPFNVEARVAAGFSQFEIEQWMS
jgi:uncharacterized ferritin-like protein (DUF455 family)